MSIFGVCLQLMSSNKVLDVLLFQIMNNKSLLWWYICNKLLFQIMNNKSLLWWYICNKLLFQIMNNKSLLWWYICNKLAKRFSVAGNRTPVSCVTGRDTHHYTTTDVVMMVLFALITWSAAGTHYYQLCMRALCGMIVFVALLGFLFKSLMVLQLCVCMKWPVLNYTNLLLMLKYKQIILVDLATVVFHQSRLNPKMGNTLCNLCGGIHSTHMTHLMVACWLQYSSVHKIILSSWYTATWPVCVPMQEAGENDSQLC